MSSSNSPCAACKFLRRKCTQECVLAPNFPPDQPQRFANVHKVFGNSNVTKLLNELSASQREDAVNSLAYEAEARLRDPVYGCVGLISLLQQRLKQVQSDLITVKKELATYIGPSALMFPSSGYNAGGPTGVGGMGGYNVGATAVGPSHVGGGCGGGGVDVVVREVQQQQQQQLIEAQHLAAMAIKEEQEIMRSWEQQQQMLRFNGGGGGGGGGFCGSYEMGGGAVVAAVEGGGGGGGYDQMESPALALGGSTYDHNQNGVYSQIQHQQHHQENESLGQLLILQQPEISQQQQGEVVHAIPLEQHHDQQQELGSSSHGHHLIVHHHDHDHQQQHHDLHHHHHNQRAGSEEGGPAC